MGDVLGFDIDINYDDPSWNDYVVHQNMWCKYQPLLEAKGYRLPAEYTPENTISIAELKKHGSPFLLTDHPHVQLESKRISDGSFVVLKFVKVSVQEAAITSHLAKIRDPWNHTIPVWDVLSLPDDTKWCILVCPRFRSCYKLPFYTISQFVGFLRQVLRGLCFMHRHNIAHCDIASGNVVLDESATSEEDDETFVVEKSSPSKTLRFRGALRRWTARKRKAARYYFIDFGLSCAFDSYEKRHNVYGVCGQHRDIPELSEETPYDPFKIDMRQVGETLKKDFIGEYSGLEFIQPLVDRLREDDPTKRPTAEEALDIFEHLVDSLPDKKTHKLRRRDDCPALQYFFIFFIAAWLIGMYWMYRVISGLDQARFDGVPIGLAGVAHRARGLASAQGDDAAAMETLLDGTRVLLDDTTVI
ncbi:kinase-like domain-containing protein [Schizophyllum amplum]|uniref:Kinase-like domain-containing protein n=1 Tax=Schizophyllum amplum TaxID=97359 RepID=A0A550CY62_9AGAR|nr:kinase-like domain-containing protein [Auriculariopsis ampla]